MTLQSGNYTIVSRSLERSLGSGSVEPGDEDTDKGMIVMVEITANPPKEVQKVLALLSGSDAPRTRHPLAETDPQACASIIAAVRHRDVQRLRTV